MLFHRDELGTRQRRFFGTPQQHASLARGVRRTALHSRSDGLVLKVRPHVILTLAGTLERRSRRQWAEILDPARSTLSFGLTELPYASAEENNKPPSSKARQAMTSRPARRPVSPRQTKEQRPGAGLAARAY